MSHSVRRAFVDWLQSIRNHLPQLRVQVLRRSQVETKTCSHCGNGRVVGVPYRSGEGQIENHVVMPALGQQVNVLNRHSVVSYLPPVSTNSQFSAGLHNDFVNHQQGSSLNLKNMTTLQQAPSLNKDVERFNRLQGAVIGNLSRKESSGGDK